MKLTYRDLVDIQDFARRAYVDQPIEVPLEGQTPGRLQEPERRALAWLEASLKILGRHGVPVPSGDLRVSGEIKSVWDE